MSLGKLGTIVPNVDCNNLSAADLERIKMALWTHGVIVIKGQNLTIPEQISFTEKFGSLVILPSFYAFENRDSEYPAIVRVGNVRIDNSVKENSKDAEYWHKDGNFRQQGENFIISILHPKEITQVGGKTGFVDCLATLDKVDKQVLEELEGGSVTIQSKTISDFKDAKPEEHYPDAVHPNFELHPVSQVPIHNVVKSNSILTLRSGEVVNSTKYVQEFEKHYDIYQHAWEQNDVVIWDNMRVIHRSMGGFGNSRRLLFRTQSQILY